MICGYICRNENGKNEENDSFGVLAISLLYSVDKKNYRFI